jgi:hypothetical protein
LNPILRDKIHEALSSVLPVTIIVLLASIILVPMHAGIIMMFLLGALMLIVGMGFFTLGADMAMMPMGEGIGAQLTKNRQAALALFISFVMGFVITIAEPDLQVLAGQLASSVDPWTLIITVAVGVGFFLALAVARILLGVPIHLLLIIFYILMFSIVFYMSGTGKGAIIPAAFDSGGVTTGPVTVPFLLAMCLGVASLRGDKQSQNDSFGFVALCSIGPILSVLVLGLIRNMNTVETMAFIDTELIATYTIRDIVMAFISHLPAMIREIAIALAAIFSCFLIFQLITRRYRKTQVLRMIIGFVYTFIGLVIFLTGVNVGFLPVGQLFGSSLSSSNLKWLLVPLCMLIGYFIVAAEPAVLVLKKQVEEVSQGAITQKVLGRALAIGMSLALALTMLRILLQIPILYFLLPGYAFALILSFFVPKIFTGIAFDAGGVCSGPLTSTFLLPMAVGACAGIGGDLLQHGFGIVAMVAMTPLFVIQLLGLIYGVHSGERKAVETAGSVDTGLVFFEREYVYG